VLTRAAAAAVGQAVTPALLRLLLPVMADEIVVGAPSVADPPFVVEDGSYRKVRAAAPSHVRCSGGSAGFPPSVGERPMAL
jgi:hypothetical protein